MRTRLVTPIILAIAIAPRLSAQSEPPSGLAAMSVAIGGAIGSLTPTCNHCHPPTHSSSVLMGRIAYANTSQTVIGFEYDSWRRTQTLYTLNPATLDPAPFKQTMSVSWYDITVLWYPVSAGPLTGLHVKGAIGLTTFNVDPGATRINSIGGGGGLGYDVRITDRLALTPSVDYLAAQKAEDSHTKLLFGAKMMSVGLALRFKGIP